MSTVCTTRSPTGRVAVVSLHGDHDLATNPAVRRALMVPATLTVVDLADCTLLDASTLGVLFRALQRQPLVVINACGIVAKALRITGLDRALSRRTAAPEAPLPVR